MPSVLGMAFSRCALLASSYGSYRGTDAGLFTDGPTLIALVPLLVVFIVLSNPRRRVPKRMVNALLVTGVLLQAAALALEPLGLATHTLAPTLAVNAVATLAYTFTSFYWLRRCRGTSSDVCALFVFGVLVVSEAVNYALSLMPIGPASAAMALLCLCQFPCVRAARRRPLMCTVVMGKRADGYFGSMGRATIDSRRTLATAALGLVVISMTIGVLKGFPNGEPISFTPGTRLGFFLLVVAVSALLARMSLGSNRTAMTFIVWIVMQAFGTLAVLCFAVFPDSPALGAVFANALNSLVVSYKWYVTAAFMSFGANDPFYYCIGGWIAVLLPRALVRTADILLVADPTQALVTLVFIQALLLLSAQIVFLHFHHIEQIDPDQANTMSPGLNQLLGLKDQADDLTAHGGSYAALSRDAAYREVSRIAQRFLLSERETEVLTLYVLGNTQAAIAGQLGVTTETVHAHIKHVYAKCGMHSRQDFIDYIAEYGDDPA